MPTTPPSPFISLPLNHATPFRIWDVTVRKLTNAPEHMATIVTPQKTFEARHLDPGMACEAVHQQVLAAEIRGEVAPDFI